MNPKLKKYIVETVKMLEDPGLLLVSTNHHGKSNVMTIGWGLIGKYWRKPVFMIAVRPSRYTHGFIEDRREFTINVPKEGMDEVVEYCGDVSGRAHDKFSECRLNLQNGKCVEVPVIKQCRLHYECQVIYKLNINPKLVSTEIKESIYSHSDYHTLYFGEILTVY